MNSATADLILPKLVAIEAQIRGGELKAAAEGLREVRAIAPNDVRVLLVEAAFARARNDAQGELTVLRHAVTLTPRWPVVHMELSKAYARAGLHDVAIETAERAVEFAPHDAAALEVAVAIANQAGAYHVAERHLRAALALWPNATDVVRGLGVCLFSQKRFAEAEDYYRRVMHDSEPDDPSPLANLGVCVAELGRNAEATELLTQALARAPDNERIKFHLQLLRGETPSTQPNEATAKLFDDYSARFDQHLVGALKYRVPERVAEIVHARSPGRKMDVLDLGCGTGLTALRLGRIEGVLVGVDLSSGMIERARRHGFYTRLRHGDLREELGESAGESYDYVIANDVFVYVGEIAEIVAGVFRALRSGGALIFSCETLADSEGDFVLRPSKRYAHSRAYVARLCRGAGFAAVGFEEIELRMEEGAPIPGYIVVAEKS